MKNIPELANEWLQEVFKIFVTLSQARVVGFNGPNPLAISEVLAFCRFKGIEDDDDLEEVLFLVQALDAAYLEFYRIKGEKNG